MIERVFKYAGFRSILFLVFLLLVFNLVLFPLLTVVRAEVVIPDLRFFYSSEYVFDLLEMLSDTERGDYLLLLLGFDMIYPVIYSLLISYIIFLLLRRQSYALFPFLIMIADYFENITLAIVVASYPKELHLLASAAGVFTAAKWSLLIVSIGIVIVGLVCCQLRHTLMSVCHCRHTAGQK